ncbi:MAG: DNA polymerase III subunit alpha [Ruminococcus sp.]|jgi:DNA polymerase-3 subunit alpha|nr:DNA polymerase III subunit alpha [Ruminococcus sp.]
MNFVHLHVKSDYSLLESSAHTEDIISCAKNLGQNAVSLTDKGYMFGTIKFAKEALSSGIKPIIGLEIKSDSDRILTDYAGIVLLAKNQKGYKNLLKIASANVLTEDLLFQSSEGLILLTGGQNGKIFELLSNGFYKDTKRFLYRLHSCFKDIYIEIWNHNLPFETEILPLYLKLSEETEFPLVASNDVRMARCGDYEAANLLSSLSEKITPPQNSEYYIKSSDEMSKLFANVPEAIINTLKISEMIDENVIPFGEFHMPVFFPDSIGKSAGFLSALAKKGMEKRFGENLSKVQTDRLSYELEVIIRMGFADYFLIVWDFVKFARSMGIPVGLGRGSGVGSFTAYCIGITGIDPIKHQLLFERFLNPERVTLPDIDVDFGHDRRHEIIEYAVKKYGETRVAGIVTFMTIKGKSAVREASRVLHISAKTADYIAKQIPINETLKALKNENGEWIEQDNQIKKFLDAAQLIEGFPKNISTHASGIVLADAPITDYAPVINTSGIKMTQFTMGYLEDVGLVKMDVLGLKHLTIIDDCLKQIKNFNENSIPLDDKKTYQMIASGQTLGVFQFESEGFMSVLMRLAPENIGDLIAVNALFRPGPMDSIKNFIDARHGKIRRRFLHPLIDGILDETYGIIVYQEQVMQIVQKLAGFSLGRADILRRAMAKKKSGIIESERIEFLNGADKNNVPRNVSESIYDEIEKFSSYAFNKSHAVAYAYIAYRTAYLKCHFPAEYLSALLSNSFDQKYINEAYKMGMKFLPPDINNSGRKFTAESNNKIRFGLSLIKGMGTHPIEAVLEERERERFYSLEDFCSRFDYYTVPRNAIENLIYSGAFDFCGQTRRTMLRNLPITMERAGKERDNISSGQLDFFGNDKKAIQNERDLPEFDLHELRAHEIEVCKIAFS